MILLIVEAPAVLLRSSAHMKLQEGLAPTWAIAYLGSAWSRALGIQDHFAGLRLRNLV